MGEPTLLTVVLGAGGAAWGLVADRIAARWPEHEAEVGDDGVELRPAGWVRPADWRTTVATILGAASLAGLTLRFDDPVALAIFGAFFAALTLLLATDLDQRLLPDVITLPMIPLALAVNLAGLNPLVPTDALPAALLAALVIPAFLFVVAIPFGAGAIGMGDLKLLVSVGLLVGLARAVAGVAVGALAAGVVLALLLAARRITLRTYVPFGPFLILGAYWAVLVAL
ncbi:MAG: prepilin peptidase [Chloroflexi bacterium]|jgi:leader peptidase (prepilin peptidase)/N-methyltransferase|nr:prepilin peptidase [Chloroflexota bacterium]